MTKFVKISPTSIKGSVFVDTPFKGGEEFMELLKEDMHPVKVRTTMMVGLITDWFLDQKVEGNRWVDVEGDLPSIWGFFVAPRLEEAGIKVYYT
jgi:hypothetical protein